MYYLWVFIIFCVLIVFYSPNYHDQQSTNKSINQQMLRLPTNQHLINTYYIFDYDRLVPTVFFERKNPLNSHHKTPIDFHKLIYLWKAAEVYTKRLHLNVVIIVPLVEKCSNKFASRKNNIVCGIPPTHVVSERNVMDRSMDSIGSCSLDVDAESSDISGIKTTKQWMHKPNKPI